MGRRASRRLLAFHRLYFLVCLVLFLSGRLKKRLSYFPREQSLSHFKKLSLREKKISFERACNGSLTTRCACQFYSTEILQKLRAKVGVHRHCLKRDRYFLGTALSSTRPPPPALMRSGEKLSAKLLFLLQAVPGHSSRSTFAKRSSFL